MYHRSSRADFDENFIRMTRIVIMGRMMTVTIGHPTMMMTVTMCSDDSDDCNDGSQDKHDRKDGDGGHTMIMSKNGANQR